ncbi:MAG: Gfo/Idh/MocA family oxidoreductase [Bacteroidota bacterium]
MKKRSTTSRRNFIKKTAMTSTGLAIGFSAKSYNRILGANDRINFGFAGLNGRGNSLLAAVNATTNAEIVALCDVDSKVLEKVKAKVKEEMGASTTSYKDYRKMLASKDIDAFAIATPDHWHAPMAIDGVKAGKHVYVEKPCCHNPAEGELLVKAQQKYGMQVQMGNQQRSGAMTQKAIKMIHEGVLGEVYHGKAWYANTRGSIGRGKVVDVPAHLDWDLFQGPAPRVPYRDNLVHYNWHWFWNWGTGESNNNGTHEMDICRWALGVDYPIKTNSSGGRFQFKDDWQFYDTQIVNFEFPGNKMITWEGRSCNGLNFRNRGRGVTIHGTKGSMLIDRNGYIHYDLKGKVIEEVKEQKASATTNTIGRGNLDDLHMDNFCNGIRKGEMLNSPIEDGNISNLMPHLANIAQECSAVIHTDPDTGHIIGNQKAQAMWGREYEPGWEPKI